MSGLGLLSKVNVKDDWIKRSMRGGRKLLILEGKNNLPSQVASVALHSF